jgi:hypothetical protein
MEETAKSSIRPFLGLPPFTAFSLVLVLRDSFFGNLQIDKLEKQTAPGYKTLSVLLMLAKMHDQARLVGLEDEVKHHRNFW